MTETRAPGIVPPTPSADRVDAIASLFVDDPKRILAVVDRLRDNGAVVESTVRGTSMGATLLDGTRIQIRLNGEPVRGTGTVVAFLAGTQIVVHRLVHQGRLGAARSYVLCRGDGRHLPDRPIARPQILGAVVAAYRDDRWVEVAEPPPEPRLSALGSRVALGVMAAALVVSPNACARVLAAMHRVGEMRYPRDARAPRGT